MTEQISVKDMLPEQKAAYLRGFKDGTMGILYMFRDEGVLSDEYVQKYDSDLQKLMDLMMSGASRSEIDDLMESIGRRERK